MPCLTAAVGTGIRQESKIFYQRYSKMIQRSIKIRLRQGIAKHEEILRYIETMPSDARGKCGLSALFIDSTHQWVMSEQQKDQVNGAADLPGHQNSEQGSQATEDDDPMMRVLDMKF